MAAVRRVCLAIGISDAGGGLDYLGGALAGAIGVHEWAQAMGYESKLLVDDPPKPVNVEAVKQALEELLPRGTSTERLILYFAGHGLISAADNGLWLPTDWHKDKCAIAAEVLRRRLREFGVAQITLIADACRKLPPDIDFADLTQHGVLGSGFDKPTADPVIDRYTATQDGLAAFMIPGPEPGVSDRCIFSGVLLEGLWGQHEAAFSKRAEGQVISSSLAAYLRQRVPQVAGDYGLQMDPQAIPGFPEESDVYFDRKTAPKAPALPPWPELPSAPKLEKALSRASGHANGDARLVELGMEALGLKAVTDVRGFGSRLPGDDRMATINEKRWRQAKERQGKRRSSLGQRVGAQVPWLVERERERRMEGDARARTERREASTLTLIRSIPQVSGSGGLAVGGGKVARLWVPQGVALDRVHQAIWQYRGLESSRGAAWQTLIEFADGVFGACVLMPEMMTRVAKGDSGVVGLVMQPLYDTEEVELSVQVAEVAIARLSSMRLELNEATAMATKLRMEKHANPVLGVISAYLYDAIGDRDSIRRMAYFYVQHGQAIPYDIAFLADVWSYGSGDENHRVVVPQVEERGPRPGEEEFPWTTCETREVQGSVGGRLPWMRRGWPFIAGTMTHAESLLARGLSESLPKQIAASTFTTLSHHGGIELIKLLHLEEAT